MLQAKLFERAEQITGKKSGRYTAAWDPEEMSILTAIMGVTKEVGAIQSYLFGAILIRRFIDDQASSGITPAAFGRKAPAAITDTKGKRSNDIPLL